MLEVSDIGPKTYKTIKPYFTIGKKENELASQVVDRNTIFVLQDSLYFDALVDHIRDAQSSIDISMFVFKTTTSRNNKPKKLVYELIKAQKRGVRIRVVLEKSGYEDSINEKNEQVASTLRKNGIQVFFDSPKKINHAKLVIVDKRYSFIGSHNLTHSALAYNHEVSLLIDDKSIARDLTHYKETITD